MGKVSGRFQGVREIDFVNIKVQELGIFEFRAFLNLGIPVPNPHSPEKGLFNTKARKFEKYKELIEISCFLSQFKKLI